jgi:hypothetical protein
MSNKSHAIETLNAAITKAINAITDENALDWFHHCGISFDPFRFSIAPLVIRLIKICCKALKPLTMPVISQQLPAKLNDK